MGNDDYDPGPPHEPPSHRRRRQYQGEQDDAWAAADENDFYDDGVEIGDLATGYVDDEHTRQQHRPGTPDEWHDGDNWSPSVDRVRERGRYHRPRSDRVARYSQGDLYDRSPTHYRDRMKRGEYGEYHAERHMDARSSPYKASPGLNLGLNIPFWQILIVVILGLCALTAVALACVMVLVL